MATATHTVELQCDDASQYATEKQRVEGAGFTILTDDAENHCLTAEKVVNA